MKKEKKSSSFLDNFFGRLFGRIASPFQYFMALEASSGILLLLCASVALFLANSPWSEAYSHFTHLSLGFSLGSFSVETTLAHFVNDGLMVIFFYLIGLEIKRELLIGELQDMRKASFAVFAALGGMIFPALIYLFFNPSGLEKTGWGIPMATDIAFAVGILALLGKRAPLSLKVFLTAFAIVDDLGAVIVIALFYTKELASQFVGISFLLLLFIFILSYSGVRHLVVHLFFGLLTWAAFLASGVHATIAGVLLAFLTPATPLAFVRKREADRLVREERSPLLKWEHRIAPWVSFLIMPLFAFFNAGVSFDDTSFAQAISHPVALGVLFGLLLGKPIGVLLMSWISIRLGLADLPHRVGWIQIAGAGMLGAIGFTMALFINGLAFGGTEFVLYSKTGIFVASALAAVIGLLLIANAPQKK